MARSMQEFLDQMQAAASAISAPSMYTPYGASAHVPQASTLSAASPMSRASEQNRVESDTDDDAPAEPIPSKATVHVIVHNQDEEEDEPRPPKKKRKITLGGSERPGKIAKKGGESSNSSTVEDDGKGDSEWQGEDGEMIVDAAEEVEVECA